MPINDVIEQINSMESAVCRGIPDFTVNENVLRALTNDDAGTTLEALCSNGVTIEALEEALTRHRLQEITKAAQAWINVYARGLEMCQIGSHSPSSSEMRDTYRRYHELINFLEKKGTVKLQHYLEVGFDQVNISIVGGTSTPSNREARELLESQKVIRYREKGDNNVKLALLDSFDKDCVYVRNSAHESWAVLYQNTLYDSLIYEEPIIDGKVVQNVFVFPENFLGIENPPLLGDCTKLLQKMIGRRIVGIIRLLQKEPSFYSKPEMARSLPDDLIFSMATGPFFFQMEGDFCIGFSNGSQNQSLLCWEQTLPLTLEETAKVSRRFKGTRFIACDDERYGNQYCAGFIGSRIKSMKILKVDKPGEAIRRNERGLAFQTDDGREFLMSMNIEEDGNGFNLMSGNGISKEYKDHIIEVDV